MFLYLFYLYIAKSTEECGRDVPWLLLFTQSGKILYHKGSGQNRCMTFADCRPQTADCRLQTADRRPQTADRRLQTADQRLQTAVCSLQSAVCSLRSAFCSLQSAVCSLRSAVCSLRAANVIHRGKTTILNQTHQTTKQMVVSACTHLSQRQKMVFLLHSHPSIQQ